MRTPRSMLTAGAVSAITLGLLVAGGLGLTSATRGSGHAPAATGGPAAFGAVASDPAAGRDALAASIAKLQAQLRDTPQDYVSWAALGLSYVQQAKVTVDPSYYPKAEQVLQRSLALNRSDNFAAMAGEAALAAARHDFTAALSWAKQGLALNPYNATLYGALDDAYTQLGRYPEAFQAVQRMLDLQPGAPAFTRAEYVFELRGQLPQARDQLQRALDDAVTPADRAYAHYYLGELSFNAGDPKGALAQAVAGIAADPHYAALLEGKAKAEAALGQTDAAIRDYTTVVGEIPQPEYLIELGELYQSLGKTVLAQQQYALFTAEEKLFESNGVALDTDPTLFYANHGDPALALRYGEAGIKIRPFIEMHDALAWALHVNGRDREALAQERQAMVLGTRNALFFYHAGMIEKSLGMRAQARHDLTTALRTNPSFNTLQAPIATRALAALGTA